MPDAPEPAAAEPNPGLPGEIYLGVGIVLVAIAMVAQSVLFDGDALSDTGKALLALW
ncbi:MAG TPA: hypothetical protein VHL98_15495 [Microvirga sp.]|nr:hypothetical protein [Microvirga sp.]